MFDSPTPEPALSTMIPLAPPAAGEDPVGSVEGDIEPVVTSNPTTQPMLMLGVVPQPEKLLNAMVLKKT